MSSELAKVLEALRLDRPGLGWYECTRHTMASLYVLDGGTLEDLTRILGHSTVLVAERYAHIRPDHFSASARDHFGTKADPNGSPAKEAHSQEAT